MNYIEQAIIDAIKGGWSVFDEDTDVAISIGGSWPMIGANKNGIYRMWPLDRALLDPVFWQSLSKARGWGNKQGLVEGKVYIQKGKKVTRRLWLAKWHNFIDHLAEGKNAESFFKDL